MFLEYWILFLDVVAGGSYFEPLSWALRLKVALGAAKGLAFLHNAETQVIYRDFKTSNILIDSVLPSFDMLKNAVWKFDIRLLWSSLWHDHRTTIPSFLILGWLKMVQQVIRAMSLQESWVLMDTQLLSILWQVSLSNIF